MSKESSLKISLEEVHLDYKKKSKGKINIDLTESVMDDSGQRDSNEQKRTDLGNSLE